MSSISAGSICYTARSTIVPKLASPGSSKLDTPCETNGPCASSPLSVSPRTVLSYRHYRRDLRDKRHLGDECSPRRRDKSVSLVSRFFSWTTDFGLHLPALGPMRSVPARMNGTKCSDYPCVSHPLFRDLSARLNLGAWSLRARGRVQRNGIHRRHTR